MDATSWICTVPYLSTVSFAHVAGELSVQGMCKAMVEEEELPMGKKPLKHCIHSVTF